jgi:hypothetical protein
MDTTVVGLFQVCSTASCVAAWRLKTGKTDNPTKPPRSSFSIEAARFRAVLLVLLSVMGAGIEV